MNALRLCLVTLLLAASPALAQQANPAEISFWESVRDSRNPAEIRAYLQQFPNGVFAPLAKARLAALESKPAAASPVPVAPTSATTSNRMPQVGDTWTYRLSYPSGSGARHIGLPTQERSDVLGRDQPSSHVVKVTAVEGEKIVDQVSVDGAVPQETAHAAGGYLVTQGVSVFSPYLIVYGDAAPTSSLRQIAILDTPCNGQYGCRATGRYVGSERITIAGRQFQAMKLMIEENWWPARPSGHFNQVSQMNGGRRITVWYARELKRAVRISSRIIVGDIPPVESNWDLELVSYQVK
jgi:hypothetical protein